MSKYSGSIVRTIRSLESKLSTVSTQLEDIQEKMYDFEQNKARNIVTDLNNQRSLCLLPFKRCLQVVINYLGRLYFDSGISAAFAHVSSGRMFTCLIRVAFH